MGYPQLSSRSNTDSACDGLMTKVEPAALPHRGAAGAGPRVLFTD